MKLQKLTKAWFNLPDDPDGARFEIKHLRSGEISDIIDATTKSGFEFIRDESDKLTPVQIFENKPGAERQKTVDKAVCNWENVFDTDGEPLECNSANKLRVCRELGESGLMAFAKFINDSRKTLADEIKKAEEIREKN